jgi:hypothetical protein
MVNDRISKGDIISLGGKQGVVCHLTAQRFWVIYDSCRAATGHSLARIRRLPMRYDLVGDQMVKTFLDFPVAMKSDF